MALAAPPLALLNAGRQTRGTVFPGSSPWPQRSGLVSPEGLRPAHDSCPPSWAALPARPAGI